MSIDLQTTLYDPIYRLLPTAFDAQITLLESGLTKELRVIDKTAGVAVGDGVQVSTVVPACDVRTSEVSAKGLVLENLKGASISFNGKTWDVIDHEMRPVGEIRLFLSEPND